MFECGIAYDILMSYDVTCLNASNYYNTRTADACNLIIQVTSYEVLLGSTCLELNKLIILVYPYICRQRN